jgi:hypothetical protein
MYNNINNWGCLIYKNVGITLDKCDINRSNILFILTSLKNSIRYFFILFNVEKKFFHSDLHPRNITYNETQKKVYFINFGSALHLENSHLKELTDIYELINLVYCIFFNNNIFIMKTNFLHDTNSITKGLVNNKLNKNNFLQKDPRSINYDMLKQYLQSIQIINHYQLENFFDEIISLLAKEITEITERNIIQEAMILENEVLKQIKTDSTENYDKLKCTLNNYNRYKHENQEFYLRTSYTNNDKQYKQIIMSFLKDCPNLVEEQQKLIRQQLQLQ